MKNKKKIKALQDYIIEVDETQSKYIIQLHERIDVLEYKLGNVIKILEDNCPGWINKPIHESIKIVP